MFYIYWFSGLLIIKSYKMNAFFRLRHQISFVSADEMLQMQTSRYNSEFTEICKIGKGGFGAVYKVCGILGVVTLHVCMYSRKTN